MTQGLAWRADAGHLLHWLSLGHECRVRAAIVAARPYFANVNCGSHSAICGKWIKSPVITIIEMKNGMVP